MKVLFCTSNKIGAIAIRAVTWSQWSHVGVILADNSVVEAVWPRVRRVPLETVLAQHTKFAIIDIPCDEEKATASALALIGKKYDWRALFGFLIHRDWQSMSQWFCSEAATKVLMDGGTQLFRAEDVHRITPQHLWMLNYPVV